jgi:hypothetical protein
VSLQLTRLRKKERLRELVHALPVDAQGLGELASTLGPQVGLEEETALAYLTEITDERPGV